MCSTSPGSPGGFLVGGMWLWLIHGSISFIHTHATFQPTTGLRLAIDTPREPHAYFINVIQLV